MEQGNFTTEQPARGHYIEQALNSGPDMVRLAQSSMVLTPMANDGYVAQSDKCETVSEIMAEFIPEGTSIGARKAAILKGMDAAYKIAQATGQMGAKPRLSLDEERDSFTSAEEEVEHLLNESLAYYFSSPTALAVTNAARERLAEEGYQSSLTFGFAVGLMMANYGKAEAHRDLGQPDDKERHQAAAEALAGFKVVGHSGEVFIG